MPTSLFLKLTIGEQYYVQISYRKSHPEQKIHVESMDINLPTPQVKYTFHSTNFHETHNCLAALYWDFLYYPNCMKMIENIGLILFCREWLKMQA